VTKAERQKVKAVNFGLIYGMGPATLVEYAKMNYGVDLPFATARDWHRRFFKYYVGIKGWHISIPDHPIETRTLLGRRRLDVKHFTDKCNSPVQGSGADALKIALGDLWRQRHALGGLAPVIAAHDEIVVQCPIAEAQAAKELLSTVMLRAMKRVLTAVEPVVEVDAYHDWGVTPLAA
jgi:DNA polymerase-1